MKPTGQYLIACKKHNRFNTKNFTLRECTLFLRLSKNVWQQFWVIYGGWFNKKSTGRTKELNLIKLIIATQKVGWFYNITEILHTYILPYQTTERCFEDWSQQAKGWLQATKHNRFNHKKFTQFYTNVHYFCWKTFDILPGKLKGSHHDKKGKDCQTFRYAHVWTLN